jgi:tetratricopeptide (TPR) repeat protein
MIVLASTPLCALLIAAAVTPLPRSLDSLVRAHPADQLVQPLRRFEAAHGRVREGSEAALELGRLHFARGEYRQAAEAFARAGARLPPDRKHEARYWAGLCGLALKEPNQARAALEEVAQTPSPRRADALLGVAFAWQLARRPERAMQTLEQLLQSDPGEAGPAALELMAALAAQVQQPEVAKRARERLASDYPRSIEAARVVSTEIETPAAPRTSERVTVQIGVFTEAARARALAEAARRAGFASTRVVERGEGKEKSHLVRLGVYVSRAEAEKQGKAAARKLGVSYIISGAP